jgi:proline iminopeptidase
MPYIEHQTGKTYYQKRGRKNASGLPLVCLHGGPGGASQRMQPLFDLADERQVFLYDQVGGGKSSATGQRHWTIPNFVRELATLVDAWGLEQFHLFGASWGTTLALEFILKHKRRVRSVTFQSPMFCTKDWENDANRLIRQLPAEQRKVIRYCHEIGATDAAVYKQAMQAYYARHVCRDKATLKQMMAGKNPNGAKVYEHMWGPSEFKATGTLRNYDQVARLTNIKQPSLVICGEFDEAQPATGRRYAKQFPRGEFAEISGASHVILGEKPRVLVKTVREFLNRQDPN